MVRLAMGRPLPVRGITAHLVWGEDGAAWCCYEVEPFGYPHTGGVS